MCKSAPPTDMLNVPHRTYEREQQKIATENSESSAVKLSAADFEKTTFLRSRYVTHGHTHGHNKILCVGKGEESESENEREAKRERENKKNSTDRREETGNRVERR